MLFTTTVQHFKIKKLYTRPARWYFRKNCDFFWSGGGDCFTQGLQDGIFEKTVTFFWSGGGDGPAQYEIFDKHGIFSGQEGETALHKACKMVFFDKNGIIFWSGGGDGPAQGLQDVQRQGCPEADRLHRQ